METMIQCHNCQEELNQADWEANEGCCLHCGRSVESSGHWISQRQGLGVLKSRLDLRLPTLRAASLPARTINPVPVRRIYA